MKKRIPWWWILIALAVLVAGGTYLYKRKSGSEIVYRETPVQRGGIHLTVLATGTVQPENRLDIKPPVAGRVERVLTKEGNVVRKGQILAWMSSTERAALIDAARAKGPEEVKRWEEIYRETPILAPINGTLILRSVEPGQTVTNSDAILTMSDRLTVKAQVDETDISQIKLKQRAEIVLDAYPERKLSAKVDQIAFDAKTVNNVTTYVVDVLPDEAPAYMKSGMTANVTFLLESRQGVLVVPADSVRNQDGKNLVLLKSPNGGKPVEREIETGITDGKRIEVISGLNEGDVVLAAQIRPKDAGSARGSNPLSPFGGGPRRGGGAGGGGARSR